MVWCLRHIPATGRNRTLLSLTHGTMANAMPQALGAKAAFPDRQVISLSGDGGLSMLLGDLLTCIQEKLAIKICVVDNSSLGFVELEQKVEGLLDFTPICSIRILERSPKRFAYGVAGSKGRSTSKTR